MKRVVIAIVGVVVLLVAAVALAPAFVSAEALKARISEQITQWIGRPVTFAGEPLVAFFPTPSITLDDVSIVDASGQPFIATDQLIGTVALLPLFLGRVEVTQFELVRPTIALRVDGEGHSNWTVTEGTIGDRLGEALGPDPAAPAIAASEVTLGRFIIRDGSITYQSPEDRAEITNVALDISWPSTSDAATASGSLVWHGERIEVSATLDKPLEVIASRPSPGRFDVESALLDISFDGMVGREALNLSFEGPASVAMESLRRVIAWTGTDVTPGNTLGRATIDGNATWHWPILSFSGAQMMLDGNEAVGSFSVDFLPERPAIRGTLALERLDLSAYAEAFRADVQSDGAWSAAPARLTLFERIDADVRLSADAVLIGATRLGQVAASGTAAGGSLLLNVGRADLYGGQLQASLRASLAPDRITTEAQLTLAGMSVQPALRDMLGVTIVSGVGGGSLDIEGSGATWGGLVQDLTGTLDIVVRDGSVRGVSFAAAPGADDPVAVALRARDEVTPFTSFTARFQFRDGRVVTDAFLAASPAFDLSFDGWGALASTEIAGDGTVTLHSAAAEDWAFAYAVGGSWYEPQFRSVAPPPP